MELGSKHTGLITRGIKIHVEHVRIWNKNCGIDPFSNDAPRHLPTNKIIEAAIVSDIFRAPELSISQYKAFINDRLIEETVNLYIPIKKNNSGIKKMR